MGYGGNVGKYQLGRTIGEGTFAKVKLGLDSQTGQSVAIKIIDKRMVVNNKLMDQVKAEITTMKLLQHPNIVRIYEVIATKTKIFIVMEYVSGGQLSDKMSYTKRLSEPEARKYFQQLIDAVEYCHCRGVFHRDLKPENLLLDGQGNLKVSDFGLSVARKPGDLLSTACGSPSYVAPEVIANRNYYGPPVDVWSSGVILFELLAGFLPFDDRNLLNLYRKISRADYTFPHWFTPSQKKLISRILDPLPRRRMTIADILEDEWFQIDYKPSTGFDNDDSTSLDNVTAAFGSIRPQGSTDEMEKPKSPNFINAFKLIAMSNDLDLSGLFEEQSDKKRTRLGSEHSIQETIEKIKAAAKDARLSVERMNSSKVKLQEKTKLTRCQSLSVSAEVIEVTPSHCVVEISKSAGELNLYKEFCRSLSGVLTERSSSSSVLETPPEEGKVEVNETPKIET